jgi:uncharacterized protein with FMN-binding domain
MKYQTSKSRCSLCDAEFKRQDLTGRNKATIILIGTLLTLIIGCAATKIVGGPIAPNSLKDGIYDGEARDGPVKVRAKVTIQNQRISDIELLEHRTWKGKAAENIIPAKIIAEQTTKVDAVSGATVSSRAIMNAVEAAVRKAK